MALRAWDRWLATAGVLAGLVACAGSPVLADAAKPAGGKPPADTAKPAEDPEVKLGRENAAENDKEVKLVTDPALLERVNRIGQEIAKVANTEMVPAQWGTSDVKKFAYTFKIVDEKDINAYSLPGGYIYVNKGLLDYVHSDDELAGVLAHEVAHAAHHHMMKLMKEQGKLQQWMLPLMLAGIIGHAPAGDLGNLMMASQLYMVAKLNTFGVEAEKDADQAGARYLLKTKYNPVGLLTFMERLARAETLKPEREPGIYRTHPPSPERAAALLAELTALKVPINRRAVDPAIRADVTTATENGVKLATVTMSTFVVARLAADGSTTAEDRAKQVSELLNALMDTKLQTYEVALSPDKAAVMARSRPLVRFTAADAEAQKSTTAKLAKDALTAVRSVIWQDQFNAAQQASAGHS